MSVVARQGVKYSIIGYLGFLLGTFSSIFIFPYDMEFYGKLRYILPTAEILVPIVVFGLSFSNVKFFSRVNADGKHHNMLSLSLLAVVINFLIFSGGYFLLIFCSRITKIQIVGNETSDSANGFGFGFIFGFQ
jgi:hypothetical protein